MMCSRSIGKKSVELQIGLSGAAHTTTASSINVEPECTVPEESVHGGGGGGGGRRDTALNFILQ